jgi:choline transporter-like protein 2/4/5
MTNALVYHFFGYLWNMAFFRHFTIMVIAGAVGTWYWTPYIDGDKPDVPMLPVYRSFYRTLRYHVGTIAFGSFIIAVIEFAQAVIEYIKRKYLEENSCLKCLASYIQCCLECFKRIMEFISRMAYIVTACKGNCFCVAAWQAFNFILDNAGQVAAVSWISIYLMFMGKAVIVLGTGVVCWLIADSSDDINSTIVLLIICV